MKLNNKGQSLVLFVLLMPILLMIIVLVYAGGNSLYEKERLNNVNYMVIDYGLDNIEEIKESDLIDLAMKNVDDIKHIEIVINGNEITSTIEKENNSIIKKFMDFEVVSKYQGKLVNNKKEIERLK